MIDTLPLPATSAPIIGVDFTPRAVEICQLTPGRESDTARFVRLPAMDTPTDWITNFSRVAGVLRRRGFRGARLVVAAPADRCVHATLDVPAKSVDLPIRKLVRMELAREHRLDPGAIESASWEIPAPLRTGAGKPLMCLGCPSEVLREMEAAASAAGLKIVGIDARAMALARGVDTLPDQGWRVICDLSTGIPTVVVAFQGKVVIEHRAVDASIEAVIARVAGDCRAEIPVAQSMCESIACSEPSERRTNSFAVPRVDRALREYVDSVARCVIQCVQYQHHKYGQSEAEIPGMVVGEDWISARFITRIAELGEKHWTIAPPGFGAARGLAAWQGEPAP